MAVFTTGDEDPHRLVRLLSTPVLKALYAASLRTGPLSVISGFFNVEMMWRRQCLEHDWRWEWMTESEGQIRYLAKPDQKLAILTEH
jgi:hypothetical protein